jgi:hypothetical protein
MSRQTAAAAGSRPVFIFIDRRAGRPRQVKAISSWHEQAGALSLVQGTVPAGGRVPQRVQHILQLARMSPQQRQP